jgi:hypothetical protein
MSLKSHHAPLICIVALLFVPLLSPLAMSVELFRYLFAHGQRYVDTRGWALRSSGAEVGQRMNASQFPPFWDFGHSSDLSALRRRLTPRLARRQSKPPTRSCGVRRRIPSPTRHLSLPLFCSPGPPSCFTSTIAREIGLGDSGRGASWVNRSVRWQVQKNIEDRIIST